MLEILYFNTMSVANLTVIEQVSKILSLPGDTRVKFSDDGVSEITVDSGLGVYRYLLPAQQK